jgi:hypothetical protein
VRRVTAGPQLVELVRLCYAAGQPLMLVGGHGIGKSEIIEEAAKRLGIGFVCRDLSLMEPPDLIGMPRLDGPVTRYLPPAFLPTEGEGLLVFEELNRCPDYMRAPCLQLLTARTLNDYRLPAGWLPCAAINPAGAEYDVQHLDPALLSRFVEVQVVADRSGWLAWAESRGVAEGVIGYVASDPGIFEDTNPRAWKAVSDLLNGAERVRASQDVVDVAIAGKVGQERMIAFRKWRKKGESPPETEALLADYRRWRPKVKAWVGAGRTDLLAALARDVKLHMQSSDGYRKVRNDPNKWKALTDLLGDLPADVASDVRKFLGGHGHEAPAATKRRIP